MKTEELKKLYQLACNGKGFEANEGQFKVWKQTLGFYEERHLSKALIWFFECETGFPMPAELKPLVERARQDEEHAKATPKEQVEFECPQCHAPFSAVVDAGDVMARICLVLGVDNQMVGCRVRLVEIGRMPVAQRQKRA